MVKKHLLEVGGSVPPVLSDVHGEVAGHHHASSVGHEASVVELSHQGIDDGHTCGAIPPSLHDLHVCLPVIVLPVVDAVWTEDLVSIVETPVPLEVSPEELIDVDCGRLVLCLLLLKLLGLPVHLPDGEAAIG